MGLLNEKIQGLDYANSPLANYQPQQAPQDMSFLDKLAIAFVPQTYANIQGQRASMNQPQGADYKQLAEYWAQQGDPQKAQQYAELAQAQNPKTREVFSRTEGVVNDQGETGVLLTYRNGEQEFKPVKYSPDAVKPGRAPATPRVPVGMMWDANKEMAVPIPGVPVKAPAGRAAGGSPAMPKPQKPLSPTEFKELTETEDTLGASRTALSAINKALEVNPLAYSGVTANILAKAQSEFGGSPRADATIEMDNLIQNQALSSMKSIFGGNPTEGERKILLDLQASATKTPKQREEILRRAKAATEARISGMQGKAQAIRTREYGTPSYQPVATPAAQPKVKRYNPATGRIE